MTAHWSGNLAIEPLILNDSTLSANSTFIMMGIHEKLTVPKNATLNIFNQVGDADASATSLNTIQTLENNLHPHRCFNRPSDVFKTGRATLPKTLSSIPGCRVPRLKPSHPKSFDELATMCEEFGSWPLIIRACGYHGGHHMTLLMDKAQLETIKDKSWLYDGIFLIEFVDYINENNLHQKTRVIFVDGIPYPRHSIFLNRWQIHAENRPDIMGHDIELCHREERFLTWLRDTGLKEYGTVFSSIQECIGLDVFGVDFALVDSQVLIFEANACMDFLNQDYGKDGRYQYLESHIKTLKRALKKMLMKA